MSAYSSGVGEPPWPDPDDVDDAYEARLDFHRKVGEEAGRIRVREAARDLVNTEKAPPGQPFDAGLLGAVLEREAPPPMRAEGLIPSHAGTLLVAQRKTGKTTLELNIARCLLTGEPLLARFEVRPLEGNVALLNYEVSAHTAARWAHEHGLDHDRLLLVNLRGRRNPLASPDDREELAKMLRVHDTEALMVDPFGRAYTGKSQNDAGEVTSWLVDLDVFTRSEVGATDLFLSAHAGWNGERTRGASALEDWADVVVTMTRDPDDESLRFLKAEGRDVEVDEDRLDFHPGTRTLTLTGTGSRKKGKDDRKLVELAVFAVRAAHERPGIGVAGMESAIRAMEDAPPFRHGEVSRAAKRAAELGHLRLVSAGPGKRTEHFAIVLAGEKP